MVVSPYRRLMTRMFSTCSGPRPNIFSVGQSAEHVQEERAEVADLGESPFRDRSRPATDDGQQQNQDRSGEKQHERRQRVDHEDRSEHEERDGDGQCPGWLVRGHVRVERVDPGAEDPGQLAAPFPARPGRSEREHLRRQVRPQRALETARGAPREDVDADRAVAHGRSPPPR
jgi:hypothetical protein